MASSTLKGRTLKGRTLKGRTLILAAPSGGLEPAVLPISAAAGGSTVIEADATAAGISVVTGIAAAVASALAASTGEATTSGVAAAVLPSVAAAAGVATTGGISGTIIAAVATSSAGATAQADTGAIVAAVAESVGQATAQADAEAVTVLASGPGVFWDDTPEEPTKPKRKKLDHDEEDMLAILAAVMPLIAADKNHEVRY